MSNENQKVTIYTMGGFGLMVTRATLIKHGRKPHAQYPDAPFVHFTEKGKRKPTGYSFGHDPYLLIVAGHDAPDRPDPLIPGEPSPGFNVTKSRYASFDPRWEYDANKILNEFISLCPDRVIADYRHSTAEKECRMNETHFKEIDLLLEQKFALWECIILVSEIYSVDADDLRDAFDERNKNNER